MIPGQTAPVAGVSPAAIAAMDADQCARLIRKLRWIGLDDEAGRLEQTLCSFEPEQRGAVIADCDCTD